MMRKSDLKSKFRLGYVVFAVLIVIEIIEYAVGTRLRSGSWPYLGVLAVIGAWPILQYFMHIFELRRRKE